MVGKRQLVSLLDNGAGQFVRGSVLRMYISEVDREMSSTQTPWLCLSSNMFKHVQTCSNHFKPMSVSSHEDPWEEAREGTMGSTKLNQTKKIQKVLNTFVSGWLSLVSGTYCNTAGRWFHVIPVSQNHISLWLQKGFCWLETAESNYQTPALCWWN